MILQNLFRCSNNNTLLDCNFITSNAKLKVQKQEVLFLQTLLCFKYQTCVINETSDSWWQTFKWNCICLVMKKSAFVAFFFPYVNYIFVSKVLALWIVTDVFCVISLQCITHRVVWVYEMLSQYAVTNTFTTTKVLVPALAFQLREIVTAYFA